MAWSDAARKAALEARRASARAKRERGYSVLSLSNAHRALVTSKEYRQNLADTIRAMRRLGLSNTADLRAPRLAAYSTKVRNKERKWKADALDRALRGRHGRQRTNIWTAVNATNPLYGKRGY